MSFEEESEFLFWEALQKHAEPVIPKNGWASISSFSFPEFESLLFKSQSLNLLPFNSHLQSQDDSPLLQDFAQGNWNSHLLK